MTRVVNLRFQPYDMYIGRAGHGQDGYWGSPVVVGRVCDLCGELHATAGSTLVCFEAYFRLRLAEDPVFHSRALSELAGKRLGCFCAPRQCHGDVIVKVMGEVFGERARVPGASPPGFPGCGSQGLG